MCVCVHAVYDNAAQVVYRTSDIFSCTRYSNRLVLSGSGGLPLANTVFELQCIRVLRYSNFSSCRPLALQLTSTLERQLRARFIKCTIVEVGA